MPCSAYDDNGKLVMVIAQAGERLGEARADEAIKNPATRTIIACSCNEAHQGLADATECENDRTDAMVLLRPEETADAEQQPPPRTSRTRRRPRRRRGPK